MLNLRKTPLLGGVFLIKQFRETRFKPAGFILFEDSDFSDFIQRFIDFRQFLFRSFCVAFRNQRLKSLDNRLNALFLIKIFYAPPQILAMSFFC